MTNKRLEWTDIQGCMPGKQNIQVNTFLSHLHTFVSIKPCYSVQCGNKCFMQNRQNLVRDK